MCIRDREAAVQENQRVMGILTCQEAKGREQLATMLAGQQGMSVEPVSYTHLPTGRHR